MKYSDKLIDDLVALGYTHCFFVAGGNVMHLIESARSRMTCVPVVHEVSAGAAAEYFNVASRETNFRAVAFVTAGPGLTNLVTAIGAAWLESRELLIIGGQARTNFLSRGTVRQIGHQEIDGVGIVKAITKAAVTIEKPMSFDELKSFSDLTKSGRKGPVFIELCLDVSAQFVEDDYAVGATPVAEIPVDSVAPVVSDFSELTKLWAAAERPMLLVGQGLSFSEFEKCENLVRELGIPVATSWNAADYLDFDDVLFAGRPNTYGMRWANAAIQQADLLISVGARMGLQQTGFNWQDFVPVGKIVQLEIDTFELDKENPGADLKYQCDANQAFEPLLRAVASTGRKVSTEWREFVSFLKQSLPTEEAANAMFADHVNPFEFVGQLSAIVPDNGVMIPCSSGGSYTTVMQAFRQKRGQLLTNDKGSASMGYGLAGAIGTAIAMPERKVFLVEGDGGFAQNLSEVGTVANRNLNLKMVVFENGGYASIRVSQRAVFGGNYIGCDADTGVGLPDWSTMFASYGIPVVDVQSSLKDNQAAVDLLMADGPGALIVHLHKDQAFFPKLTSRLSKDGSMQSNPIHLMSPELPKELADKVFKYLPAELRG